MKHAIISVGSRTFAFLQWCVGRGRANVVSDPVGRLDTVQRTNRKSPKYSKGIFVHSICRNDTATLLIRRMLWRSGELAFAPARHRGTPDPRLLFANATLLGSLRSREQSTLIIRICVMVRKELPARDGAGIERSIPVYSQLSSAILSTHRGKQLQ
eukprot:SAG11_NODE_259_length_11534_cov_3.402361_10_plen_156_part_00